MRLRGRIAGLVALKLVFLSIHLSAEEPAVPQTVAPPSGTAAAEPVTPKPLSEHVDKGLAYLMSQQHEDGGWGQGGGWRQAPSPPNANEKAPDKERPAVKAARTADGRVEGKDVPDPSDIGNTCIAALALLRSGSSPSEGPYAKNLARAVEYVCRQVETADATSLYVTDVRDTQLQSKIGTYADTFLAGWFLAEIKGKTKDHSDSRTLAALDKVIAKIEKNQNPDGTFANNRGWAAVHSQGLCGICLTSAAANGVKLKAETLARDYKLALNNLDVEKGEFKTGRAGGAMAMGGGMAASAPTNAGIDLYQLSVQSAQIAGKVSSNRPHKLRAERVLSEPASTNEEKAEAKAKLADLDSEDKAQQAATKGIAGKLGDKRFVAGFGNNGGEEFLSYMNISAALLVKGGPEWKKWDDRMVQNLDKVQNSDGSWSGQHCITGRTFCTSTALLTLTADRAPATAPVATDKAASPAGAPAVDGR